MVAVQFGVMYFNQISFFHNIEDSKTCTFSTCVLFFYQVYVKNVVIFEEVIKSGIEILTLPQDRHFQPQFGERQVVLQFYLQRAAINGNFQIWDPAEESNIINVFLNTESTCLAAGSIKLLTSIRCLLGNSKQVDQFLSELVYNIKLLGQIYSQSCIMWSPTGNGRVIAEPFNSQIKFVILLTVIHTILIILVWRIQYWIN